MGPDAVETSSQHRGVGFRPQSYGSGVVLETGGPPHLQSRVFVLPPPHCSRASVSPLQQHLGRAEPFPVEPKAGEGGVGVSPWVLRGEKEVVG